MCVEKETERRNIAVYRIAVLTEHKEIGQRLVKLTKQFCMDKGFFPSVELYHDQEEFFETIHKFISTSVIVALQGVAGLNAAEHFRSICPDCGLIWCSDLDFSLHAFKIRADYFILEPVSEEILQESLMVWWEKRMIGGQ